MKIKGINENYFLEINKCGVDGISIGVGDIFGSSMSVIVDKKELKKFINDTFDIDDLKLGVKA